MNPELLDVPLICASAISNVSEPNYTPYVVGLIIFYLISTGFFSMVASDLYPFKNYSRKRFAFVTILWPLALSIFMSESVFSYLLIDPGIFPFKQIKKYIDKKFYYKNLDNAIKYHNDLTELNDPYLVAARKELEREFPSLKETKAEKRDD